MSGGATGQPQKMRDFVSRVFQGSPDLSILTHAIIRKKYLDHVGLENLSKQEKEQLKQLVEEELVQMKVDQPPSNVDLRTEAQNSFKSGDRKRPLHTSHSLEEEIKNEQEHKRQKIEKKLEISSDKKDSEIDSKKRLWHRSPKLLRNFSDSSGQGDSGAEDHSAQSESDEEITRSKRRPSLQEARGERGRGSKSAKDQGNRGSQKRVVSDSEEVPDTGQSDFEEEVKISRKVTKENSLKQRDFKKKVDKESKATDPKDKAKNRTVNKQREEKNQSEGETDLSEVEEISGKKREWNERESEEKKSFSTNRAQGRIGVGTQRGLKGNESEDASGSDSDKSDLQKKMADSQCRRKSRVLEDSGSSSEDSAEQSPVRKVGTKRARGERGSQHHSKPERQPNEREGRKKMQREDSSGKKPEEEKKMTQRIQESESESEEHKSSEEEKKRVQDPTSSEGESQSKTNQDQPRKAALISHSSESESDESKDGGLRGILKKESKHVSGCDSSQGEEKLKKRGAQRETNQDQLRKATLISHSSESEPDESKDGGPRGILKKESKHVSGSDSSQGEEKLKKKGAPKSQKKSISKKISMLGSEDSISEFGGKKKTQSQQQRRTKKLKRRSGAKEKEEEESSKEEGSGSEEDEPTSHHPGKDKHSGKNEEHPSIQRLKRYIRECGAWRNYKKLLAGCRSRKAQIEVLKEELEGLGIKGTPSLAKCKAIKQKREEAAEVASLDINNIIATEGRPKRRNVWSLYNKPQDSPSSPEEPTVRRHTTDWSQLRGVISSDGESS
ncbi:HIRA-interacting protein 3 isoform X1 [Crotalus tigris]|uniref:HIRA-interacting protein 3 isoform X1 n=1 Tax=Crotalus tigris TaxID=88082 RepID=UPI00192FAFCA|nr:HIRA-interacting protein 3 isoform X1 [Crotalus tigris]